MCKHYSKYLPLFLFLFIFATTINVFGQGLGKKDFLDGEAARKRKDWDAALKAYDAAIGKESNNYKYYARKGMVLKQMKKSTDAIAAFNESVKYNTNYTNGYVQIAMIYYADKKFDDAIKYFNMAYDKEGDAQKKIKYKIYTAKLFIKDGKPDKAVAEINTAKTLPGADNDPSLLVTEGEVNGAANRWQDALNAYQKALAKAQAAKLSSAQLGKYKFGVGLSYYKLDNQAEYKKIYDDLKSTNPTWAKRLQRAATGAQSTTKYLALSASYLKGGIYDEALKNVNKAIEANDNLALAHKMAAIIYQKTGQISQAITSYSKSAQEEKDPKKKNQTYSKLINLQFTNKDYNGALATAEKILSADPSRQDPSILHLKGQAQYFLGQYAQAVASCEQAVNLVKGTDQVAEIGRASCRERV